MAFKIGDPARRFVTGGIPIVREGLIMGAVCFVGAIILYKAGLKCSPVVLIASGAFALFFFRNPKRQIPGDPKAIVSPADGRVVRVETKEADGKKTIEVSIFLSIFNVHINRAPLDGRVNKVQYLPGSFKAAFNGCASEINEQNVVTIENNGQIFEVKQIAGLIARRIVCWIKESDLLKKGERFGLIQFGSRVDMVMPADLVSLNIKKGDKVKGGISIIGSLK